MSDVENGANGDSGPRLSQSVDGVAPAIERRLLITGGSGFIGSEAVKAALVKGFVVKNLDIKAPDVSEHLPHWSQVDVRDRPAVLSAMTAFAPTHVLHMASDIDITHKSISDYRTIIDGTQNVIDGSRALAKPVRFVHVSTQFVVRPGRQSTKQGEFDPYTLYGEAKAEAERILQAAEMDWIVVRPTIIWGPRHPSFAENIWKYMASGAYLHPVGRRPIMRCFGYVTNTAHQMIGMLEAQSVRNRIFYLGDGNIDYDVWADAFAVAFTARKARRVPRSALLALGIAGSALKAVGVKSPIDYGRYHRMTTSSPIDLAPTFAVVGKPPVAFDKGVLETIKWLSQLKPNTFEPVQPTGLVTKAANGTAPAP